MSRKPSRHTGRGYPAESFVAGLTRLLGRRIANHWVGTLRRLGRLPTRPCKRYGNGGNGNDPKPKET